MHPYSVPVQKKVPLAPALSRMSTSVDVYWYGPSSYASASIPGDVHLEMTMPGFGARLISSSGLGVGMARPGAAARRRAMRPAVVVVSIVAVSSESWRKGCWRTKPVMRRRRGLYHGGISTAVPERGRPFFWHPPREFVGGPTRAKGWYVQTARYQRGWGIRVWPIWTSQRLGPPSLRPRCGIGLRSSFASAFSPGCGEARG